MQALSSQRETPRPVWKQIRLATPTIMLAALLGAGSKPVLAQEGAVKSSPLLHVYTAGDYDDMSDAQTTVGSTPAVGHVEVTPSWPDGTAWNHSLAGSRETVVIVPDLINLDVTDAEQAVHSVGLDLKVTGIGVVVVQPACWYGDPYRLDCLRVSEELLKEELSTPRIIGSGPARGFDSGQAAPGRQEHYERRAGMELQATRAVGECTRFSRWRWRDDANSEARFACVDALRGSVCR